MTTGLLQQFALCFRHLGFTGSSNRDKPSNRRLAAERLMAINLISHMLARSQVELW